MVYTSKADAMAYVGHQIMSLCMWWLQDCWVGAHIYIIAAVQGVPIDIY